MNGIGYMSSAIKYPAEMIVDNALEIDLNVLEIFVSGGGVHNRVLMAQLSQVFESAKLSEFGKLGVQPDAKEALLFAVLANETLAGTPLDYRPDRGVIPVHMGKISLPR